MNVPAVRALSGAVWGALLLVATAWACSVDDTDAAAPPGLESPSVHAEGDHGTTVSVRVEDGEVVGGVETVEVGVGDEVTIQATSDEADEMHVHGYDLARDLEPGKAGVVTFRADIPGEFDVELEGHHLGLLVLRVR